MAPDQSPLFIPRLEGIQTAIFSDLFIGENGRCLGNGRPKPVLTIFLEREVAELWWPGNGGLMTA